MESKRKGIIKMKFGFYMPVQVIGGENAVLQHLEAFTSLGSRPLIVTGNKSAALSGAYNDVTSALIQNNSSYLLYSRITQNPLVSSCRNAARLAIDHQADYIIGIGGGSPLDAAKAIAALAANPAISDSELFAAKFKHPPLPILLVGTTAGTGSEVTATSVLTIDMTGTKKSVNHPSLYAKTAFADPKYTYTLPYDVTVSTALDAFSHAVEGYFSPRANDVSDLFAVKAILQVTDALQKIKEDRFAINSHALRDQLYSASLLAGMTLNACGTAFCHPLGYILTERFGVPHGKACTTFFAKLLDRALTACPEKSRQLLSLLNVSEMELKQLIRELTATDYITMNENEIESFRNRLTGLKNFSNSPGGFSEELALETMKELFLK